MVADRLLVPEWRDEQLDSRYPFSDSSTLISTDGWEFPKDLFIDIVVYVVGASAPIYMKTVTAEPSLVTFTFNDLGENFPITGTVNPYSTDTTINLLDQYGRPAGIIICDEEKITRLRGWPLGTYEYETQAELVASTVIPLPENYLSGFILPDGSLVTGDVWFFGDNGVVITKDEEGNIRFDLVGDPLFLRKLCGNRESYITPNFIKTVNGVPPDAYGNFAISSNNFLAADSILRIYPDLAQNVIKIEFVGQKLESVT